GRGDLERRRSVARSTTICFPTRRTPTIRLPSRVSTIAAAGDFRGSGFEPSQTDSIRSPVTRLASPRAMVSTSGSSGIKTVYRCWQLVVRWPNGGTAAPPFVSRLCASTGDRGYGVIGFSRRKFQLPIPSTAMYHVQYTPARLTFQEFSASTSHVGATSVCDPAMRPGRLRDLLPWSGI